MTLFPYACTNLTCRFTPLFVNSLAIQLLLEEGLQIFNAIMLIFRVRKHRKSFMRDVAVLTAVCGHQLCKTIVQTVLTSAFLLAFYTKLQILTTLSQLSIVVWNACFVLFTIALQYFHLM
ncbi:Transmembrane domain-containing protein [Spironucleus salmonicida]|uniref:Transmembrane domain-containing protein n=1 Tax=Spironucleus salmonicida TaxID=348837 RepID=V6LEA3_9EUKA|nr:Transmembrane domain-containing protein [Spironucleus salmonicida]|eukprot:EST42835.1 Transmembrane domain-containing protein [Spironucleus salmonicida]